jgi:hypothetical protein
MEPRFDVKPSLRARLAVQGALILLGLLIGVIGAGAFPPPGAGAVGALARTEPASRESQRHRPLAPPGDMRQLYRRAAVTCPGLPWEVLAAIAELESRHGQDRRASPAGALGPMQFLPSTWAIYGADADRDGRADVHDAEDAVHAAARLLCANGGGDPDRLPEAIFRYNPSREYVEEVLARAARYEEA